MKLSVQANQAPTLEIFNLEVNRGNHFNLIIDHLDVKAGEILAIIGPNGAGKSTLLLAINRLLLPTRGQILLNGKPVETFKGVDYRRQIGLVLQEPLLLDMTVRENIALGLKYRGYSRRIIQEKVDKWLEKLNITEIKANRAAQISGGEAQRVSLARALVLEPELLLMDEPFSSLDQPTRLELINDLRKILTNTTTATVFITHDQEEALMLADRVAVLIHGRLRQVDTPQVVFTSPVDLEVAEFVGIENILTGKVAESSNGNVIIDVNGKRFHALGDKTPGDPVLFCIRPEDITLYPAESERISSARNRLIGTVTSLTIRGPIAQVNLDCGFPLIAMITKASLEELSLHEGMYLMASFKASVVHLIDR